MEMARHQMVQQQIRTLDVFDPVVLDALKRVQRDAFVPAGYEHVAYGETDIPIGHGQFMSAPTFDGRLLQALRPGKHESVLEIGTGTAYLTACLATLANNVTSIDIFEDFVSAADARLADAGIDNVSLHCMDALAELPEGQFDVVAVGGSLPTLDERLIAAIKPGGRMFVVTGDAPVMSARLIERASNGEWQSTSLFETDLPPLLNAAATPAFYF